MVSHGTRRGNPGSLPAVQLDPEVGQFGSIPFRLCRCAVIIGAARETKKTYGDRIQTGGTR